MDVTGDSRPEIVLNLFNDSGDGQWHVLVLNAATGETLFDLPRQFVQGSLITLPAPWQVGQVRAMLKKPC